jgi:methanogenic corrinoid protein MtbC1
MSQEVLIEQFFETLINGDRAGARAIIDRCTDADVPAEAVLDKLIWPTLHQIETLFREDQLSVLAHNFATRLLRMLADQMQLRMQRQENDSPRTVLLVCGPTEPCELAAQLAADRIEAGGHTVFFAGGGIANDEIMAQLGELRPDALVCFSSAPADLPHIRVLIDSLHDQGTCPDLQIIVGGGVFNRADGLAEEIGADTWASDPAELLDVVDNQREQRMQSDQRTVGRRRRQSKAA